MGVNLSAINLKFEINNLKKIKKYINIPKSTTVEGIGGNKSGVDISTVLLILIRLQRLFAFESISSLALMIWLLAFELTSVGSLTLIELDSGRLSGPIGVTSFLPSFSRNLYCFLGLSITLPREFVF